MKKLIIVSALLFAACTNAGPLADVAKAKFESDMLKAVEEMNTDQDKINAAMSQMPLMEKQMRGAVRAGLKEKKSCLKIKRDFINEQKDLMAKEDWPDKDFVDSFLSASGDYVATVCLDMK